MSWNLTVPDRGATSQCPDPEGTPLEIARLLYKGTYTEGLKPEDVCILIRRDLIGGRSKRLVGTEIARFIVAELCEAEGGPCT